MKVHFRQSGGFAGVIQGCEFDTEDLRVEEAKRLEALVKQVPWDLPVGAGRAQTGARDITRYELVVETERGERHLTLDDLSVPEKVWPLLEFLLERSSPRKPR